MASKKKLKRKNVVLSRTLKATQSKLEIQQHLIVELLKRNSLSDKDYYVNFENNIAIMYNPRLYMYFDCPLITIIEQLKKGNNKICWDIFGRKEWVHEIAHEYIKGGVLIPAIHDTELATLNEVKQYMKGQDTNASN